MFGRRGATSGTSSSSPEAAPPPRQQAPAPTAPAEPASPSPAEHATPVAPKATVPEAPAATPAAAPQPRAQARPQTETVKIKAPQRSQEYYATKASIFNALVEAIDLSQLARLDAEQIDGHVDRHLQPPSALEPSPGPHASTILN